LGIDPKEWILNNKRARSRGLTFATTPVAPLAGLAIGLVLVIAYSWVLDDAFVYFRYADNVSVFRLGLVYNKGEYVEGYTSPLWMLMMAAIRLLHLRYWPVILASGLAGMAMTWALALRVNLKLSPAGRTQWHLPALWIAGCYAVNCHFTSGLETPLVQVFAACFAALVLEPEVAWLQVAVGLGPLARPELNLAFGIAAAYCYWRTRRLPVPLVLTGMVTQLGWMLFRLYYYADIVPNTFHLKNVDNAVTQGFVYLNDTLRAYYLYWIIGVGLCTSIALFLKGEAREASRARAVLWLAAALHAAYVVRIGGDFVHYRYLAFPVLVLVLSFGGIAESFSKSLDTRRHWVASVGGVLFLAAVVASYPRAQLARHPLALPTGVDTLNLYRVEGIEDAASHRGRDDLAPSQWDEEDAPNVMQGGEFTYVTAADSGWCRDGYMQMNRFFVQSFGLTDPIIAHIVALPEHFHPGHRWALLPLATDLTKVRKAGIYRPLSASDGTVFDRAVREGRAPAWIVRNLEAIDAIERRTHGKPSISPNVVHAFERWPRIRVTAEDVPPAAGGAGNHP
jgi:hypothetical protein